MILELLILTAVLIQIGVVDYTGREILSRVGENQGRFLLLIMAAPADTAHPGNFYPDGSRHLALINPACGHFPVRMISASSARAASQASGSVGQLISACR